MIGNGRYLLDIRFHVTSCPQNGFQTKGAISRLQSRNMTNPRLPAPFQMGSFSSPFLCKYLTPCMLWWVLLICKRCALHGPTHIWLSSADASHTLSSNIAHVCTLCRPLHGIGIKPCTPTTTLQNQLALSGPYIYHYLTFTDASKA